MYPVPPLVATWHIRFYWASDLFEKRLSLTRTLLQCSAWLTPSDTHPDLSDTFVIKTNFSRFFYLLSFTITQDALRAKRNQERLDREWRKKEADEAAKKWVVVQYFHWAVAWHDITMKLYSISEHRVPHCEIFEWIFAACYQSEYQTDFFTGHSGVFLSEVWKF